MVARCHASVIVGVRACPVVVEADVGSGLPGLTLVGLADTAVSESRDRVRTAFDHSGLTWPRTRVTVALLPASLPKRGSALDAAIAVAILAASGQVPPDAAAASCILGELGLDGRLHPVPGVIATALSLKGRGASLLVPAAMVDEAALVEDLQVGGVHDLAHLVDVLRGDRAPAAAGSVQDDAPSDPADLCDVRGQWEARRALEVCAAGGHHLSMMGLPGVGKTLLAERLPGLLPSLEDATALEVTAIHSAAGRQGTGLIRTPPFESPHHTASAAAIIGGGHAGRIRVGAATLAHRGVLFLDEAPEFPRNVLDALRQPLESGEVQIARADISAVLPARFTLVLAANPCPCGQGLGMDSACRCTPQHRRRYASKLSGPVLDRIDVRVVLDRPTLADLGEHGESSAAVAARVAHARHRAHSRWTTAGVPWRLNAEAPGSWLRSQQPPQDAGGRLLRQAFARGALTMRGADRVLRVAWTLADLQGVDRPAAEHVATAMALRGTESPWAA
jgi:magnesium chelatase family protein